ncbi:MAG: hypothetical protein Q4A52_04270 [Bacillota bacterium]|nr:hypothetical protein [Bacillota bacterium]
MRENMGEESPEMSREKAHEKARRRAPLTTGEKVLVAVTAIFLLLLIAKSLYIDGYARSADYNPDLLRHVESRLELAGGIVSDKVLAIHPKETKLSVHTRKYLFYVFPIEDDYREVELP